MMYISVLTHFLKTKSPSSIDDNCQLKDRSMSPNKEVTFTLLQQPVDAFKEKVASRVQLNLVDINTHIRLNEVKVERSISLPSIPF
jgi:hypothetical protein